MASQWIESRLPGRLKSSLVYSLQGGRILLVLVWVVRHEKSLIGRLLHCRAMVHLGMISFSLYLWQQLFFVSVNRSWTGRFPSNILLAALAAEFSYFYIERPILDLRRRLASRDERAISVATPALAA